ncbi:MAG TPA: hypothetical protein VNE63_12890 [Candidatus Acidoferrales bacterium]|nr:hypothetical protein [Candidatus Acidoferrales bacterium]
MEKWFVLFQGASFPQPSSLGKHCAYNARAMFAARYFALIREMKDNAYNHRLRLVETNGAIKWGRRIGGVKLLV